jgi:hypothetical protein
LKPIDLGGRKVNSQNTLKAFAITILVAGLTLGLASHAEAGSPPQGSKSCGPWIGGKRKCTVKVCEGGKCMNYTEIEDQHPSQPPSSTPPESKGSSSDAALGAAAAGTMIGIAIGSMANQPKQESEPQVIVIQEPAPPEEDAAIQEEMDIEIEQERERIRELEEELERLKSEREK